MKKIVISIIISMCLFSCSSTSMHVYHVKRVEKKGNAKQLIMRKSELRTMGFASILGIIVATHFYNP